MRLSLIGLLVGMAVLFGTIAIYNQGAPPDLNLSSTFTLDPGF
jgi:hypothetical protein